MSGAVRCTVQFLFAKPCELNGLFDYTLHKSVCVPVPVPVSVCVCVGCKFPGECNLGNNFAPSICNKMSGIP